MIEVTIIIPSYNRYPLNLLTLHGLERQAYDMSKMEVILIDDASTDQTALLKDYYPPYTFRYVKNSANLGVAHSRNIGLELARGKVVIFLDAEMLVEPHYVKKHYHHHLAQDNLVVVENTAKLYSFLFPKYNKSQIKELGRLMKADSLVKKRIAKRLGQNIRLKELPSLIKNLVHPVQLLNKKDLKNFSAIAPFAAATNNTSRFTSSLGQSFATSPLAWMVCFGNLSVKKSLATSIGGHDESFKTWGPEDADFGYRLAQAGATFIVDPDTKRYHQEHPLNPHRLKQNQQNSVLFQEKHPVLAVGMRYLILVHRTDNLFAHQVLVEHASLVKKFPHQFNLFIDSLVLMMQQIPRLEYENKPVTKLLNASGISYTPERLAHLHEQKNKLASLGNYPSLIQLFDWLIQK